MSHVVRRTVTRSILIGLASLTPFAAAPAGAAAATIQAPSAAAFRDSIGVATHFDFEGYAYQGDSIENLQSALRGLGVRHIRDHACFDKDEDCAIVRSRLAAMADTFGPGGPRVGTIVIAAPLMGKPALRAERDAEILRALRGIRDSPVAAMTEGIEMVNEPDYKGGDWAAVTVADAKTLRAYLATPEFASLRDIPVFAPALGKPTSSPDLLKAGWTKDLADVSNAHPYPMPYDTPEKTGIANECTKTPVVRTVMQCATDLAGTTKAIATEAGYSTAGYVNVADWVSQQAQATYTLRMLLHNFKAGVPRTYLYELLNLEVQQTARNHGYGLMQTVNAGGTRKIGAPKPVYHAIANLNKRIGDLGATALPGSIDLTLTDPATGTEIPESAVEKLVLRRADGKFMLAVWQPAKAWLHNTANFSYYTRDLAAPVKTVRVGLDGSAGGWDVKRFTPVTIPVAGDDFRQAYQGVSSVEFGVDEDVTLLELTPPAPIIGPVAPAGEQPGTTVPETAIPGTTIVEPVKAVVPPAPDAAPGTPTAAGNPATPAAAPGVTAPSSAAPRPAGESRTAAPGARTPGRDRAAAARERANRLARARSRARRAYGACLDRQVAKARRRTPARSGRPRPSRPTKEMRARCGRWLAR